MRWMDDDVADLRVMKIRQWTEKAKDREQWRLVVKEAKAVAPGGWMHNLIKYKLVSALYVFYTTF